MYAFAPRTTAQPASQRERDQSGFRIASPAGTMQARLDETLNRSPRVASTRRLGHALNHGPKAALQAHLAQFVTSAARPQRALSFSTPDVAAVQRMVRIDPEVLVRSRDVAASWKGMPSYADTYTVINGKRIPPTSNKVGSIKPPEFGFLDREAAPPQSRFQLQLRVPTQVIVPLLELPTFPVNDRWELTGVTVGEIDAFVEAHSGKRPPRSERDKEQPCTLVVVPEGDLAGKIESHERRHLQDNLKAVDDILVPWDDALEDSKDTADTLVSRGPLELLNAYDTIGPRDSAQVIADRLVARIAGLGEAYHETEEGQPPVITGTA